MTRETNYRRLLVAPQGIRSGLIENIDHEIANHRAGLPARIRIKVNSVVDEAVLDALYRASNAGVRSTCGCAASVPCVPRCRG